MKIDFFQSCGHCWVFQVWWHIECSTFTALSFRIWNSSTGIPSPPLALFVVMIPKALLALHSRMSGSRWVITPTWSSGLWKLSLYSSSVYSCLLFLISSAYVRSMPFLSFIEPIFAWNVPLVSLVFLRSLVFPIQLFFSISSHWSLRKGFLSLLVLFETLHSNEYIFSFLLCLLLLFFQLFCMASSDNHFAFLHFFFLGWSWLLPPVHVTNLHPQFFRHCLSDLIPWIYLSLPLYNHKGFDLGHTWMVWWFSLLSSI